MVPTKSYGSDKLKNGAVSTRAESTTIHRTLRTEVAGTNIDLNRINIVFDLHVETIRYRARNTVRDDSKLWRFYLLLFKPFRATGRAITQSSFLAMRSNLSDCILSFVVCISIIHPTCSI